MKYYLSTVLSYMTTAFFCAVFVFSGCEQAAGSDSGGMPEQQAPILHVLPGNQCITVSWENLPDISIFSIFAGTGDEMPDSNAGPVTITNNSAVINGLENNTAYNVWVVESAGENRKITNEKVVPVNAGIPAGKFAGSEYIYGLDGVTYTKYRNDGLNPGASGIIYSGTIVFADGSGAIIIKTSEGAYRAVKVTYENKLYKVAEATETPEIPDDKNGTIIASFGDAYTANIVVGKLVTFDSNGGDTEASPAAITVEAGKTVGTLPVPPAKANFQFSGWKKADGSAFTADTVVDSNITVYAQWWTAEGGTKTFAKMGDMKYFLENFYGENSAANPVDIVLTDAITTDDLKTDNDSLGNIFDALDGKYVTLDMSAVTGTEITKNGAKLGNMRKDKDKLVSITLPSSLEKVGEYVFEDCTSLESVDFPDTLADLGKEAFAGCTALTSVEFPDTLTDLGKAAFKGCASLSTVTLPSGVTEILDSTFEGCASLDFDDAFFANITKIGASAFKGSGITSFTVSQKITQIGDINSNNAFENCIELVSVDISALGTSSLKTVGASTFAGCSKLKNLTLPTTGLESIGAKTFMNCAALEEVTLPESLTQIGGNTFDGCTSLRTVTWTKTGASPKFGVATFANCTSLRSFSCPEGITSLNTLPVPGTTSGVFYNTGLEEITLPESLTTIPANTFKDSKNLTEIIIKKSSTAITLSNVNAFTGTPFASAGNDAHIYVPDEATVTAYKSANKWKDTPPISDYVSVKPNSTD
jgi:hypothetical protein